MSQYKDTLNLPKTTFPFNTVKTGEIHNLEKATLAKWEASTPRDPSTTPFVLHDGPPFANGDIHMGHVINKTLKDVTMRFHRLMGFRTPYRPGWDCHGLPIENLVKENNAADPTIRYDIRSLCAKEADAWSTKQSKQFQRLGITGDWHNPYRTMNPSYEAAVMNVFADLVEKNLIYRAMRPVRWSVENKTALAEAELEYREVEDKSIFVAVEVDKHPISLLVWTTTPWSLPANRAIAIGLEVDYCLVKMNGWRYVIARNLAEKVLPGGDIEKSVSVHDLLSWKYIHPLSYGEPSSKRWCPIVASATVSDESGTGLVHIAPGHGDDDYQIGLNNNLEIYCPITADCLFDDTAPEFLRGVHVWKSNAIIIDHLTEHILDSKGAHGVLSMLPYKHEYPFDERSGKPVITRATYQWFVALDRPFDDGPSLRERAIAECELIKFVPSYGKDRLLGMLRSRPDWCISRQRQWGIPIPVAYKPDGEPGLSAGRIRQIAEKVGQYGSQIWYNLPPEQLMDMSIRPGRLKKEEDIFDVWFESGCSWTQINSYPADVYIEGTDQHRGWFQHSLLLGVALKAQSPFRELVTHGFIVGPDGKKLSKRDKNYVTATAEIEAYGAEPLRLWVCSLDFTEDMKLSPKVLKEFIPKFDKIRNTLRFLLSNLYDFDLRKDYRRWHSHHSLESWMLWKTSDLRYSVLTDYEDYRFHAAFQSLFNFCAVEVSAIYGNAMKDRLYCSAPDDLSRRLVQSVMFDILVTLTMLFEPIMPFTASEIWDALGGRIHIFPNITCSPDREAWELLFTLRESALIQLDRLKHVRGLNKSTEAMARYHLTPASKELLCNYGADLEDIIGVGFAIIEDSDKDFIEVNDARDVYKLCQRSWKRRPDVGSDAEYPDLSLRDATVMKKLKGTSNVGAC